MRPIPSSTLLPLLYNPPPPGLSIYAGSQALNFSTSSSYTAISYLKHALIERPLVKDHAICHVVVPSFTALACFEGHSSLWTTAFLVVRELFECWAVSVSGFCLVERI